MLKPWKSGAAVAVTAIGLIAAPAYAADIVFSFDGATKLTGILYGLTDNAVSTPTGISITSTPGDITIGKTVMVVKDRPTLEYPGLTLSNGVVTAVKEKFTFTDDNNNSYVLMLNAVGTRSGYNSLSRVTPAGYRSIVSNNQGFYGVHYSLLTSAVPEPASWMLMILGFGVIGYAIRTRKVRLNGAQLA